MKLNFRTYNVAFNKNKILKNSPNEFQSGKKRKGFKLKVTTNKTKQEYLGKPVIKSIFSGSPGFLGLEIIFFRF
jgi:hypothetical protein